MKRGLISLICLLTISSTVLAQKVSKIDFDLIKAETTNSESEHYYPKLLTRFVEGDTNLTIEDYAFVYYGNVFTDNYNPYGLSKDQSKFMELYREKKYKKAIAYGEKVLKENPVNLKITFKMMVCHHVIEELDQAKLYAKRYFPVLDCIYKGGDGLSEETALVVIMVADEYEIMADMKVSMTSQSLVRNTDVLTLKKQEGNIIEKLYFNVSMPLKNMAEQFKK